MSMLPTNTEEQVNNQPNVLFGVSNFVILCGWEFTNQLFDLCFPVKLGTV